MEDNQDEFRVCSRANREHSAAFRAKNSQVRLGPDDPRHGTQSRYVNHGCRCSACAMANALASDAYYKVSIREVYGYRPRGARVNSPIFGI